MAYASIVNYSQLDYCNSLYYCFPKSQINRRQQVQNSLARAVIKLSNSVTALLSLIFFTGLRLTNISNSLHTYKVLTATEANYLLSTSATKGGATIFNVGGTSSRAERAKNFFLTPPLLAYLGGT